MHQGPSVPSAARLVEKNALERCRPGRGPLPLPLRCEHLPVEKESLERGRPGPGPLPL